MIGKINVTIRGVSPLLMNQDTGERPKIKDHSSPENKEREFQVAQYRDSKGVLMQPAEMLEKALEVAGGSFQFKGAKKYGKVLCGGVFIEPQEIPHKVITVKKVKFGEVEPFAKMVRIPPRTGARVMKTRAIIRDWELDFVINVVNDSINFDTLQDIVTAAGAFNGIGDWRPKYGRFEVIKFEKQKEKKNG